MGTTEKKSYERSYLCEKIIEECYDSIVVTDVLSDAQKKYAALDAWACLKIYNQLKQI